jgi:hypothetical protein
MSGRIKDATIFVETEESSELLSTIIIPQLVNAGFTLELTYLIN